MNTSSIENTSEINYFEMDFDPLDIRDLEKWIQARPAHIPTETWKTKVTNLHITLRNELKSIEEKSKIKNRIGIILMGFKFNNQLIQPVKARNI